MTQHTEQATDQPVQAARTYVWPTFRYDDAPAAIRTLTEVFGFRLVTRMDDGDKVAHAELAGPLGGGVMLGSTGTGGEQLWDRVGGKPTSSTYVVVDNPDELHDRCVAAGLEIVLELTDQDYGSREFTTIDAAGNLWTFGTYAGEPT